MALTVTHQIGSTEVTILTDGAIAFPAQVFPEAGLGTGEAPPESGVTRTNFNAVLIREGGRTVLVDAGPRDLFGPDCGNLPKALAEAGAAPADIDRIFATHLHPDHIAGMIDAEGRAAFPNAELAVLSAERDFWLQNSYFAAADQQLRDWQNLAQAVLDAYADRLVVLAPEAEIAPGLTGLPLPGHTPGHSGWRLDSDGQTLIHAGDIVHAQALQLPDPEIGVVFDLDAEAARAARRRMLDMLAADDLLFTGGHFLHPAFNRVSREGSGFRLQPAGAA
ncbi:MBL fold metallo-hydrolase [Halodurantibacterium flavum]|uniref:MBL fold metallo-hydrolase n=1 Tax=Halodurantibacterium flavum TaxID=1382802 RepID=A0ABW4S3A9_9RHOB